MFITKKVKHENCAILRKKHKYLPLVEVNDIHITSTSINLHINLVECMILNDEPSRSISERRIQLTPVLKTDNIAKQIT